MAEEKGLQNLSGALNKKALVSLFWQKPALLSFSAIRFFCAGLRIALLSPPIRHQVFQGYGLSCFVIHHNFHILVFFIQLIQKLTASAAGHTAAASRRCFIPKSDKPLDFCLTAVHIHIQGGCTLGAQIHNTAARFNAKARVNTAVCTFQRTYYVVCINKRRYILRVVFLFSLFIKLFPYIHNILL